MYITVNIPYALIIISNIELVIGIHYTKIYSVKVLKFCLEIGVLSIIIVELYTKHKK